MEVINLPMNNLQAINDFMPVDPKLAPDMREVCAPKKSRYIRVIRRIEDDNKYNTKYYRENIDEVLKNQLQMHIDTEIVTELLEMNKAS